MTQPTNEIVLCSRADELPPAWLPEAGAITLDEPSLVATLAARPPRWLSRPQAEQDPTHKQWIPYVLLRDPRDQLAAYPRRGTESRLHGHWSLGLGGHINPVDAPVQPGSFCWRSTFHNALRRELAEEFPAALPGRTRLLGIIHENRTAVGCVHLGAVFLHETEANLTQRQPASELAGLQWLPRPQVGQADWPLERFELWSQLALQLLTPLPASAHITA